MARPVLPRGMSSLADIDCVGRGSGVQADGILPIRTPAKVTLRELLVRGAQASGLTPPAIDTLVTHSQITDWRAGQQIVSPDDRADLTHFVVSGAVRLDVEIGRDHVVTVAVLPPGRFIGSILPTLPGRGFTATAHVPSIVAVTSHARIREICRHLPDDRMLRLVAEQTRTLDALVRTRCVILASGLRERVLTTLTDLARDFGRPSGDHVVIELPLRHEDLTKMVVGSRANVTRALLSLRRDGLVDVVGRRLALRRDRGRA